MALHLDDPAVTDLAHWRKLAEAVLKGADFDETLTSKTLDGIRIEPLYAEAEGRAPIAGRPTGSPWTIMQRIDDADPVRANKQALTDLENGANGLTLVFKDSIGAHGFGIDAKAELVADILKGVYLDAGIDIALDDARAMIEFRLASDSDQFLSIAKHRALRKLWASIETQCGLTPKPIFITSETASRMLTMRDAWVNLLRIGMGCFAAAIGGANAVSVLPFTSAIGLADPFARRLARNTQLVLAQESHLASVADPAAGAGGYEALTDALVEKAWAEFQSIEQDGGVVGALHKGAIQARVKAVAVERHASIEKKKSAILGVTLFPDAHEKPISVLAPMPPLAALENTQFEPLIASRIAEPFEAKMPKLGAAS